MHFVAVDVKSTRMIGGEASSLPKCVRLARMFKKTLRIDAVPGRTKDVLEPILGMKFMGNAHGHKQRVPTDIRRE